LLKSAARTLLLVAFLLGALGMGVTYLLFHP